LIKNTKIGSVITYLDWVNSTNNYVANLVQEGKIVHGQVIMSDYQGEGRGQRGSNWYSEPGKNLLLSVFLEFDNLSVSEQAWLLKYTAVSILTVIQNHIKTAKIKWPNDIFVNDKKICGILIENQFLGSKIKNAIIGVGLNVNQENFGQLNATSLKNECNQDFNRIEILESLINSLNFNLDLLLTNKMELQHLYRSFLYRIGAKSTFYNLKMGEFLGTIIDVNLEGRLVVQVNGELMEFELKEIQLID
jgi:BirA family biotin operon repressor/biotin-[acetyl-CoA-carboxylase] ligase